MRVKKPKTTENNVSTSRLITKRLLRPLVFLIAGSLIFSFTLFKNNPFNKVTTIVIDAGHGGKDPGCSGVHSKEKEVTLAVALKLGKLIEEKLKDVKVIYTRKTDVFVELEERAQIANRNNADLFISIHCNAASYMTTKTVNGKKRKVEVINTRPYGSETYVMGLKNEAGKANVVKRENSVMLLEDNYKETYQGFDPNKDESYIMMSIWTETFVEQSGKFAANIQKEYRTKVGRIDKGVKRESLWVLWRTKMPSVLTEIGYLTNPEEEKFLSSDKGQYSLAAGLFRAFRNYKNDIEGTNIKYDDDIEHMEPIVNENVANGDTSYMHEVEEYANDNDTADDPKEKLKQLYKDANQYFSVGDYNKAEEKYNEIKTIKPDDKTAKDKLAEIAKARKSYGSAISKADALFRQKKFNDAKKIYGDAQVLMPKEKYPTEKIKECESNLKAGTPVAVSEDYALWIKRGDEFMKLKNYASALEAYNKALSIKPGDSVAKLKIEETEKKNSAEPKIDNIKYATLISEGDKLYTDKLLKEAKAKYFEASLVKPSEEYPKNRIAEITKKLDESNALSERENEYTTFITAGNTQFSAKNFEDAVQSFRKASSIFPDRGEPKQKIADCENAMKKAKDAETEFLSVKGLADKLYTDGNWSEAKLKYEEAFKLKPDDGIMKKIADCKTKIAEGEKKEKDFDNAMKYGENYLLAKDYVKAKESFTRALNLKPDDDAAKLKVAECDKLIGSGSDNSYNDAVSVADAYFLKKDFKGAIEQYKKAALIKPEEEYPKFQVRLCEKSLLWQKQNEEFSALVLAADKAKANNDFEEAINKYKGAAAYISSAPDNKNKFKPTVDELNARIADLNNAKSQNSAMSTGTKKDTAGAKTVENSGEVVEIKVQFMQSSVKVDTKASRFNGIENISFYSMNGMYKYTAGAFYTVDDAAAYRDKLKSMGYNDAFLVAFRNGQRIDIKTAVELLSKNPGIKH